MDVLKAGAKYEFNFGAIDFSKGIKVIEINYSDAVGGESVNLLEDVPEESRPILRSKNDFIELIVMLKISSSMAEVELGKFTCHSSADLNGTGAISVEQSATFLIGIPKLGITPVEYDNFKIYSNGIEPEYVAESEEPEM